MTKIELEIENLKGIMIDGYAPTLETLRGFDWKELRKYLPKTEWFWWGIPRYLRKDLSEKQVLRLFGRLVYGIREEFCEFRDKRGRTVSLYFPWASGGNYFSLEKSITTNWKKELADALSSLTQEYRRDEEKGQRLYMQNVIILPTIPKVYCRKVEECNAHWIKKLNFDVKNKNKYKNHDAFTNAWKDILKRFMKHEANELKWFESLCNGVSPLDKLYKN